MYFPILRGRQNELIAIRELVYRGLLNSVIPVIEPVKASSTLLKSMEAFIDSQQECYVVMNPSVGLFDRELQITPIFEAAYWDVMQRGVGYLRPCFNVSDDLMESIEEVRRHEVEITDAAIIYNRSKDCFFKQALDSNSFGICLINDSARRQARMMDKVLLSDPFIARARNADYRDEPDEFFTDDHHFYSDDGYVGFSDYSIVGSAYSEGGFRPRAVALHVMYKHHDGSLFVHHAVSNDLDFSDAAQLYYSALENLFSWVDSLECEVTSTYGLQCLRDSLDEGTFPGLGMAKRWTIMHHLELISNLMGR